MSNESAKSILLLPGMDGTGALFADLIAELPPDWNVTIARYPTNEFLSYKRLLAQAQTIAPRGRFTLVAESFSTPLAVQLACSLPERVTELVLAAGFVANPLGRSTTLAKMLTRTSVFRAAPPEWLLRKFLTGDNAPHGLAQRLRGVIRSVSHDVLAQRVKAVLSCDERTALARMQTPLLYLQGKHDRVIGPECFEVIREIRPDTRLEVIDAPHLVLQCQPRAAAQRIVEFAQETATDLRCDR